GDIQTGRRRSFGQLHSRRAEPETQGLDGRDRRGRHFDHTGPSGEHFVSVGTDAAFRREQLFMHWRCGSERDVHAGLSQAIYGAEAGVSLGTRGWGLGAWDFAATPSGGLRSGRLSSPPWPGASRGIILLTEALPT